MGGISPYMSITWPSPVGIGLKRWSKNTSYSPPKLLIVIVTFQSESEKMTQNKSTTKYKENWAIRSKKVHESNAIPWPLAHGQNMKRNLVKYNKRRDVGSEGAGGAYAPSDPQTFRHPCEGLWKQLCYFWNNVTLLWVPSLLELGLVLGKITLVLVGVNTHGQSSHQVLDRRSPNYPQLSDHYLNCTTEKDLTRRPEWTLFEQAVFSPLYYHTEIPPG